MCDVGCRTADTVSKFLELPHQPPTAHCPRLWRGRWTTNEARQGAITYGAVVHDPAVMKYDGLCTTNAHSFLNWIADMTPVRQI